MGVCMIKKKKLVKKKKKHKKIRKFVSYVAILLIISLIILYNIVNYNLYKKITGFKENDKIEIYYEYGYLVLWDKTVKYLNSMSKEFTILKDNVGITFNSKYFRKTTDINKIKFNNEIVNYENVENLEGFIIDFSEFDNLDAISSLSIIPTEEIKTKKYIDIYYEDKDNTLCLYKNSVDVMNDKISFEIFKDSEGNIKNKYICINVPVLDLKIASDIVEMKNKSSLKLDAQILPENATNKNILYEYDNKESLTVSLDGVVNTKNVGDFEIKLISEDSNINKTVKLKVRGVSSSISIDEIETTYVNGILLVNKSYGLSSKFNPGVDQTALNEFNNMKKEALKSGVYLNIISGFRSYQTQVFTYNDYVSKFGRALADTFSAKPGYSEHQTGLAFDIGAIDYNYGNTKEGKWLVSNSYKYGFILRYPKDKQSITGYRYEPWHFRYVGNPVATDIYNSGLCLEEYLNIY